MTHLVHQGARCFVDVDVLLGGGLEPAGEAILPHILVHAFRLRDNALLLLVALQRKEEKDESPIV